MLMKRCMRHTQVEMPKDLDRWVWSSEWSGLELCLVVCFWDRDGNESQGLGRDQWLGETMILEKV